MFDEHVRGCVCPCKGYVEHVRAFKHVENLGVFDEHVCPRIGYIEHVRRSSGSSVSQARGHAYNTSIRDWIIETMTGADRTRILPKK
jgi:hypothetical protein